MEKLIHRNIERPSLFFEGFNSRNGVVILDSRDVTPKQASSLLDFPLGQHLGFAQFPQTVADDHVSSVVSVSFDRGKTLRHSRGVLLFLNPLVDEPYPLAFIQAAMLCPEHIHHALVSPHQMLLE